MAYCDVYYSNNYNTFDEWLELVIKDQTSVQPFARIPYGEWAQDYINNIESKSIEQVKELLRCLLGPINRKLDILNYQAYKFMKDSNVSEYNEIANSTYHNEMYSRIEKGQTAWEGLTWILELLPSSPYNAIKALESYLLAQDDLPDDRIVGIEQCIDIIMAKFIYSQNPLKKLTDLLKPVEFEWLIEGLYQAMGYTTEWTPAVHDGGKDIIATIARTDGIERVYVECKLYTTKLKIETVRALNGVIMDDKINRGVIFCTGYVSKNIKNMYKTIQIWTYEEINILLNAHLGSDWSDRLTSLIEDKRCKHRKRK